MIGETERILICCSKNCTGNGAQELASAIEEELEKRGRGSAAPVKVVRTGCAGECDQGPIVRLMPNDVTYYRVSTKHVAAIVDSLSGKPVKKLLFKKKREHFKKLADNPFFGLQHRVALRYVGVVDPLSIEDFIAHGGYDCLKKSRVLAPAEILSKLQESGLRIKRSALTSPLPKWLEAGHRTPTRIVCNVGTNGFDDPVGSVLAEGSPHAIIEGMALALRATRAREGIFIVGQKAKEGYDALNHAIGDALASGVLASTPEGLEYGAALSVADDTAALAHWPSELEDESTNQLGREDLHAIATLSIDAETLAALPFALGEGPVASNGTSTDDFSETKTFALGGKAKHTGFVEVSIGTPLRTLIFKIGGGVASDRPLKAVQVGNPAYSFIPEHLIDLSIDFDLFAQHGIPMDAGSVNILDDRTCIVKTTRNALRKLEAQSPNTNLAFGEHLRKAITLLERLCDGGGEPNDSDLLNQTGLSMRAAATTRNEHQAANCLLSSIEHFRNEYEAHAHEKRCPAGSCPNLTQFVISPEACAGCDACSDACPSKAITGDQRQPHVIDYGKCISCGVCRDVCRFHAVLTERKTLA